MTSIVKQKEAERKTEEALEKWSFTLDSAGQGAWDCNVPTDSWTYSANWKKMRGIPEGDFVADDDTSWLEQYR